MKALKMEGLQKIKIGEEEVNIVIPQFKTLNGYTDFVENTLKDIIKPKPEAQIDFALVGKYRGYELLADEFYPTLENPSHIFVSMTHYGYEYIDGILAHKHSLEYLQYINESVVSFFTTNLQLESKVKWHNTDTVKGPNDRDYLRLAFIIQYPVVNDNLGN